MQFRYIPPAREEWRAFFIQIAGSLFALLAIAWWQALQAHFNVALFAGTGLGILYLLFTSAGQLHTKSRRARNIVIELRPEALAIRDRAREDVIPWSQVKRCEAAGTKVEVTWVENGAQRKWSFAPRDVLDGQTLAREVKQRATPNFIALDAK